MQLRSRQPGPALGATPLGASRRYILSDGWVRLYKLVYVL